MLYRFNKYNPDLEEFARQMRKNMTEAERILWFGYLKQYPVKITRQKIIDNYIADFYCAKARLIIELDGSQHYMEQGMEHDCIRTETLRKYGLEVLRFSNLDLRKNFRGVCEAIDVRIKQRMQ